MPALARRSKRRCLLLCLAAAGAALAWWSPRLLARYELYWGRRALEAFRTEDAIARLESANRFDPHSAETHFLLGRAFRHKGQFDDMNRELEEAGRLGTSADRIQRELRLSIAQTARVAEVEGYLPQMLTSPGDDGREICAAFVTGLCLRLDFAAANMVLDAWSGDLPNDPEPHARRGDLYYSLQDWKRGAVAYRECLARDASRRRVRLNLARCLINTGDADEAEAQLRVCVKNKPDDPEAWSRLGACLAALGKIDEARRALETALEYDPRQSDARWQLGELEVRAGRPEEALRWVGPVFEQWPEDSRLATTMAQALEKTGRTEEANKCWDSVRKWQRAIDGLGILIDK